MSLYFTDCYIDHCDSCDITRGDPDVRRCTQCKTNYFLTEDNTCQGKTISVN